MGCGSRPLLDGAEVALGRGHTLPPVPGMRPAADSHPTCLGRGGLNHRLGLESCLCACLFVVWLKRVAQLAQLPSTKGSCL